MSDGATGWVNATASGEVSGKIFTPIFTVATNSDWNVVSDQPWLTVTKSGYTFTLTATCNEPLTEAKVTVTGGAEPVTITVNRKGPRYMLPGSPETGGIVDLALIYSERSAWTQERFKPYLTWTNPDTQKEEWLFDGFLFLEIWCSNFNFANFGSNPATKANMIWYLDRLFEKNRIIDALDQLVGETIQRLGAPPRPRRVVLMVPDPPPTQVNWGELNGKAMDCRIPEDRIAVTQWYIDQVMERWEAAAYQNIEFVAFYWVREEIYWYTYNYDADVAFVKACIPYIHSLGKPLCWIPYWDARGYDAWKQIGFDVAYQQPGYFWTNTPRPESHLRVACNFSERRVAIQPLPNKATKR
jgi:hypothetical protein